MLTTVSDIRGEECKPTFWIHVFPAGLLVYDDDEPSSSSSSYLTSKLKYLMTSWLKPQMWTTVSDIQSEESEPTFWIQVLPAGLLAWLIYEKSAIIIIIILSDF